MHRIYTCSGLLHAVCKDGSYPIISTEVPVQLKFVLRMLLLHFIRSSITHLTSLPLQLRPRHIAVVFPHYPSHFSATTPDTMPPKDKYSDPKLREEVKEDVKKGDKGGAPGQWSARKAQMMASEYKKRGGDVSKLLF